MTDDLEALQSTRADVEPPSAATRHAARARWDHDLLELTADAPSRRGRRRGAPAFALRSAIAGAVAVAIVAGAWAVTRSRIDSVKPSHVIAVGSLAGAGADGPQVFLLVGSDSRAFVSSPGQQQQFGDPGTVSGERSDTMVLVRLDPASKHVLVVSIPRDLWVDVPGCGMEKINAAFNTALTCGGQNGGADLLVQTITHNFAVPVDHVIEVQFPQFVSLVDQLGGLRVDFPVPARDQYTGLDEPAGCVTLTGEAALGFVRSRHYEFEVGGQWAYDPTGDLGRIARQQLALRQLAVAAEARAGTDPRPLLRALFADITVDSGFTADDALRYFDALRDTSPTMALEPPVTSAVRDGQQVLLLGPSGQQVFDAVAGRGSVPAATGRSVLPGPDGIASIPTAC